MSSPGEARNAQPQFITSHANGSNSNGPGAPLIDSIDVDQIVISEVPPIPFMLGQVGNFY
jgi:natural resistance-associated macrophage protein 2